MAIPFLALGAIFAATQVFSSVTSVVNTSVTANASIRNSEQSTENIKLITSDGDEGGGTPIDYDAPPET